MPGSYAARQPLAQKGEEPVTVLVTGFGVSVQLYDGSFESSHVPQILFVFRLIYTSHS
jgi:hypothetical protein